MDPTVALALEALRAALAHTNGRRPICLQVQVIYSDATSEYHSLPVCPILTQAGCVTPGTRVPTDTERAILAVLERATEPLKGRTIASRARAMGLSLEYGSHLRRTLAEMVKPEDGRLIHVGREGYWLAGREVPHTET